jgi:hypothetical protein
VGEDGSIRKYRRGDLLENVSLKIKKVVEVILFWYRLRKSELN